jgi:hypothetical protein
VGERTRRHPKTGETISFPETARDTEGKPFRMSYAMSRHAAIVLVACLSASIGEILGYRREAENYIRSAGPGPE